MCGSGVSHEVVCETCGRVDEPAEVQARPGPACPPNASSSWKGSGRPIGVVNVTDLAPFADLVALDHGLSVVVTLRADHTPHTTVVNAGVLSHLSAVPRRSGSWRRAEPANSPTCVDPTIAVVVRAGWQWTAVEGSAQLIGPDDPHPDVNGEQLRLLLRDIFTAAGGTHDDWATYDQVMRDERRTAVLVSPNRVYSNPA